jgi:ribosomal protein S18 acetylase RimI-like enzyme
MRWSALESQDQLSTLKALQDVLFPVKYSDSFYEGLLDTSRYVTLLVWEEELVAASTARIDGDMAYLCTLGVATSARKQGLGTRVLDRTLEQLWQRGTHTVQLHVKADNNVAINMYHKAGFIQVQTIKNHYFFDEQYHDAVEMEITRQTNESLCTII